MEDSFEKQWLNEPPMIGREFRHAGESRYPSPLSSTSKPRSGKHPKRHPAWIPASAGMTTGKLRYLLRDFSHSVAEIRS